MTAWHFKFEGTRPSADQLRKKVGRMQNRDGDVDVSLLRKERGAPYKIWSERDMSWIPLAPGDWVYCAGDLWVAKYGVLPDLRVVKS